ncbi:MAG: hypothetical protein ACK55I_15930, partial [bacterium]
MRPASGAPGPRLPMQWLICRHLVYSARPDPCERAHVCRSDRTARQALAFTAGGLDGCGGADARLDLLADRPSGAQPSGRADEGLARSQR